MDLRFDVQLSGVVSFSLDELLVAPGGFGKEVTTPPALLPFFVGFPKLLNNSATVFGVEDLGVLSAFFMVSSIVV